MRRALPLLLLALLAALLLPRLAAGQGEGTLRDRIDRGRQAEQRLGSAAARLGRLERAAQRDVAVLRKRLADVQADLGAAETRLARGTQVLEEQQARLQRTRRRLAEARRKLATLLRGRYEADTPDLVGVVMGADGFGELVSRMQFLQRVAEADATIVRDVKAGRDDAARRTEGLRPLVRKRQAEAVAVRARRDAAARMTSALEARLATLAQARAARVAALRATRSGRRRAERALSKLLAERARAARQAGPGGPWAIPWPVVECESGGQNLPPNFAGASGYYQFLPSTWKGMGGSTPHAYQASKAEQDRLARRLWAGGAGARNWVCAGLVGIT